MSTGLIQELGCVRLELENRPENVAVVRAALSGMAEAAGLGDELEANLKTTISEACNNIVLHAYAGERGPMTVDLNWNADQIDVVVADRGTGIQRVSSAAEHMGLGLALISALSDQAEFRSPQNGGTEVRMRFRRDRLASEGAIPRDGVWHTGLPGLEGDVVVWCEPVPVLRHLLGRVARAVAARSHFTVSGAQTLYAINDAMANYAETAADGHVVTAITGETRRLALDAGPFLYDLDEARAQLQGETRAEADGAPTAVAAEQTPAEGGSLAELVDKISFEREEGRGLLHVVVRDSGRDVES